MIQFTKDNNNNSYYLSPNWNYSNLWGYPDTGGEGRYCYSLDDDKSTSFQKLKRDLAKIKRLGFNAIRVFIEPEINNGNIEVPTGSYSTYFSLIDQFLNIAKTNNLKVILVIGANKGWEIQENYILFLENISNHLKNNPTIFAYDLYNEPFYDFSFNSVNDKMKVSNWVSEWCSTIRKNAPYHLITTGLTHPETIITWDPLLMPIDFVSFHIYGKDKNLQSSKEKIDSYLYWIQQSIEIPWLIGETGYSGSNIYGYNELVGTEADQNAFLVHSMQKSVDCGCLGYSWWQYQEINWDNGWEKHLGIINHFGELNGFGNETKKEIANKFKDYKNLISSPSNCSKPSIFYNINNHNHPTLSGRVMDFNNQPVKNAVIVGWINVNQEWPYFTTFSDENGYFELKTNIHA